MARTTPAARRLQAIIGTLTPYPLPIQLSQSATNIALPPPVTPRYFTLLYGILDLEAKELRFVSAGHPRPVHSPKERNVELVPASGFPIGMFPERSFTENTGKLSSGDRIYLYTDGLTDAQNAVGVELGTAGLLQALEGARHLPLKDSLSATIQEAIRWRGGSSFQDDLSMLLSDSTFVSVLAP